WTATDDCANTSTCSATWTWTEDTTAPALTCAQNDTIDCEHLDDPWSFTDPTSSDNCGTPTVVISDSSSVTNPDGSEEHCRTWTATDACGNTSTCTQCIHRDPPCVDTLYCGFTQGFWGNAGGQDCHGQTTTQILQSLLTTSLNIGCNPNTFTVGVGDYQCILDRLPGGGPSAQIFGTNTCNSIVGIALHSGNPARFRNVLLAQTITLMLNARYDVNLGGLQIGGIYMTTQGSDGCDSTAVPVGSPQVYVIPQSIITYLGANNTVNDLLALANDALCGAYVPGPGDPTLGDINKALDAFNQGFDECRFLVSFSNTLRDGAIIESDNNDSFSMIAYPNPFNSQTSIEFTPDNSCDNLKLEIFDAAGAQVAILFNGPAQEGSTYKVDFNGANYPAGVYIYRINTGSETYYDKLILIK
ncbi:MAG TPA: T9SS type A sorting domain-containing protein, partial [Bacteroidia bacterium]|nr:T9SS type A sorting domain-containing protein [Bacteroidia bacterium]